jgi:hypothetical protein
VHKPAEIHLYKKDKITGRPMNRWDIGAGSIIGYELKNGLTFTSGYQAGFFKSAEQRKNEPIHTE